MTPDSPSALWLQLLALLAVEIGVIALGVALLQRWIPSATWRRAFWQVALMSVLGITLGELSGSARGIAGWALNTLGRSKADLIAHARQRDVRDSTTATTLRRDIPSRANVEAETAAGQLARFQSQVEVPASARPDQPLPAESSTVPKFGQALPVPASSGTVRTFGAKLIEGFPLIWLAGSVVVAGRVGLVCCAFVIFRWRRRAVTDPALLERVRFLAGELKMNRRVRVVQSARLTGPIAFGLVRPTVALPLEFATRFDAAKKDAILAHELAHLAAWDPFWYRLADAAAVVLWWHPAVWWLRRQLHAASESAADEASLLVADGPKVLAECLVELGGRLVRPRLVSGLGVEGFRSHLGRRVHRLLHLEDRAWSPPRRWHAALVKGFGPMAMVAVAILCTAWVAPRALMKGDSMKTLQKNWKRSLAAVTLLAAFNSPGDGAAADAPAGAAARPVTLPTLAAPDVSAYVTAPPMELTRLAADSKRKAHFESKLEKIVLPEVLYDGLPLGEVVRNLLDESRKRDPDKEGVNFLVNPNPPPGPFSPVDPTTGLPVATAPQEVVDLNSVSIKINPSLRNVTMKDVLDVIVKVADKPIQYSLEDYGVVFSLSPETRPPLPVSMPAIGARTFKVNTNTFVAGLQSAFGIKVDLPPAGDIQGRSRKIQSALKDLLSQLGITMDGNKSVFYNELTGIVMVRGTEQDLFVVDAAMVTLGRGPEAGGGTGGGSR